MCTDCIVDWMMEFLPTLDSSPTQSLSVSSTFSSVFFSFITTWGTGFFSFFTAGLSALFSLLRRFFWSACCLSGGRNVLRISSRLHVFFFCAFGFFVAFFFGVSSESSPTISSGLGSKSLLFFFNSSVHHLSIPHSLMGLSSGMQEPFTTALYCSSRICSCLSTC